MQSNPHLRTKEHPDQTLAEFRAANPFGQFVGAGLIVLGVSVGIAVLASG